MDLYPLRFEPVYKDYVWGGDRIARRFGRRGTPGLCAESWEIADRPEGMSVVSNGAHRGRTLHELVEAMGELLVGAKGRGSVFPLLVKIIDAREKLSVQVHPDEASAGAAGGEPKTEMWYVLEAAPGARVYCGFARPATPEAFRAAVREDAVAALLKEVPVRSGEAVIVPGGRVHAIGEGCLLLEVQQNSNTTYRMYDWGRLGAGGAPRELHLEQAVRVTRWDDTGGECGAPRLVSQEGENRLFEVGATSFFRTELLVLKEPAPLRAAPSSFQALFVSEGLAELSSPSGAEKLAPGSSCLVPASLARCSLRPLGGPARILRITIP